MACIYPPVCFVFVRINRSLTTSDKRLAKSPLRIFDSVLLAQLCGETVCNPRHLRHAAPPYRGHCLGLCKRGVSPKAKRDLEKWKNAQISGCRRRAQEALGKRTYSPPLCCTSATPPRGRAKARVGLGEPTYRFWIAVCWPLQRRRRNYWWRQLPM